MPYAALALDFDGTVATDGKVPQELWYAIQRLKDAGKKVVLVTGRTQESLDSVLPKPNQATFDALILENGGVLLKPASQELTLLAKGPRKTFIEELKRKKIQPLIIGKVIVATTQNHEKDVVEVIRRMSLPLQISFNRESLMITPTGVNKWTGVRTLLLEYGIMRHQIVCIGDGENDDALLSYCGFSVAVANAVPSLKNRADYVTEAPASQGVIQFIDGLLEGRFPSPI